MNNTRWISSSRGLGQYAGTWAAAPSGMAMFLDRGGVNRRDFICGEYFRFVVKDYLHVWFTQYKDGGLQYDGPLDVPSAYTSVCGTDPGVYHGTVYELTPMGAKGRFLSESLATIYLPEDNPGLVELLAGGGAGGGSSLFGLDTNTLMLAGAGVLALMLFSKKRG